MIRTLFFAPCTLLIAFATALPQAGFTAAPLLDYTVTAQYPHDSKAFTQGLVYHDGLLYEGTGLLGNSSIRRVELNSGRVLQKIDNDADVFGEGITLLDGLLYQLTWQNGRLLVYDAATLKVTREFALAGEGWGITHNNRQLIVSDGTSTLYFHDPQTFEELRRLAVTDDSEPITLINELEYFNGFIYANQWHSNHILKIDPADGRIVARVDLSRLAAAVRDRLSEPDSRDVLNGIAWDAAGRQLLVTGKHWPTLFAIRLH